MIIYQTRKSGFLHDVHHRDIEEVIHEAFRAKTGHRVSKKKPAPEKKMTLPAFPMAMSSMSPSAKKR